MADLEVGHLGLVAGLNEDLVPVLDEFGQSAAQDVLLAEEVGLRLLAEGGLEGAGAGSADGLGVGQDEGPGLAGGVLLDAHEDGHAPAGLEFTAHRVTGPLGGDHDDVVAGGRLDVPEVDVEAMREKQRRAILEIRLDLVLVQLGLNLIGGENRHDVRPGDGLGDRLDSQPDLLGPGDGT